MNTRTIETTRKVFGVLFWVGTVLGVILLLVIVAAFAAGEATVVDGGDLLDIGGPVDLSVLEPSTARLAIGGAGVGFIAMVGLGLFVLHTIRTALGSVLEGSAFKHENYQRLRSISYAIFWVAFFEIGITFWLGAVVEGSLKVNVPITTLVGGLLALSIAEIYRAGVTLQDEAELTV